MQTKLNKTLIDTTGLTSSQDMMLVVKTSGEIDSQSIPSGGGGGGGGDTNIDGGNASTIPVAGLLIDGGGA